MSEAKKGKNHPLYGFIKTHSEQSKHNNLLSLAPHL
jgi:hypothetical protein